MKIAIVGAGAMGSLYGALLSKNRTNQVILIDIWQPHVDAINKEGLLLEEDGKLEKYKHLKGTCNPESVGVVDLALIFVKSTMTREAMRTSQSIFGPETIILTLQNGLGNMEIIGEMTGSDKVLAGTTAHGATMLGPGRLRHAGSGKTVIGELSGEKTKELVNIEALFNGVGIETEISKNVQGILWDKLLVNVGINALTGITHIENGKLLMYPEIEQLLELAVEEGLKVAKAKGIKLEVKDPINHAKDVCRATATNKSSMLQDVLNGKNTEIESINGAIVKEGTTLGLETPINFALMNMMKFFQRN